MTLKDIVKDYLEREPKARERKNKDRALVNLLMKRYPALGAVDRTVLIDMVRDYNSMDRAWRQTLEQCSNLRGTDYDEKEKLEQAKIVDLGYEVGQPKLRI